MTNIAFQAHEIYYRGVFIKTCYSGNTVLGQETRYNTCLGTTAVHRLEQDLGKGLNGVL